MKTNSILLFKPGYKPIVISAIIEYPRNVTVCAAVGRSRMENYTRRITCQKGTVGRIIRIDQEPKEQWELVLCEVEVFGTLGETAFHGNILQTN